MPRSAPPPLTGRDPARAADLSRKIGDRLRDTKRHYNALVAAMAWFGDDFDAEEFQAAFNAEDPDELNRVKSVERGVDQLYNYAAELGVWPRTGRATRSTRRDLAAKILRSELPYFFRAYAAWVKAGFTAGRG